MSYPPSAPAAAPSGKLLHNLNPEQLAAVTLPPHPDRVLFFEYNFLYVLAANGRAEKSALGDHSPAGYQQRARFYDISDEARLAYGKRVAAYLIFLAETTGLATAETCAAVTERLNALTSYVELLADIAPAA